MGTNYTRSSVASGFDTEASINQNFIDIQTALERSFSNRGDSTNGSNSMFTNIDMQSLYTLLNLPDGTDNAHPVNLRQLNAKIAAASTGLIASSREVGTGSDLVSDVWTFPGITYNLGTDNLYVFVNGVLQTKGTDYTETSTSSITFIGTNKPQTNDSLVAITNIATSTQITDAAAVQYTPGGTGSVTTDVQDKLQEYRSVEDFGAVGNGTTDDSTAFTNAAALGKTIYLTAGKTYLVNSNIPCISHTAFVCDGGFATIKNTSASSVNIFSGSGITDNRFENILFDMPVCSASLDITPMDFTNVTRFSAHRCLMDDGYNLVHLFGGTDVYITECRANTPYSYGVILADDITRAWVLDGYYHDSIAHDGIKVAGSVTAEAPVHQDIHIRGNTCYNNNRDGIDVAINDGFRINITDNLLYNNTLTGIEFKLLDTDPVKLKRCKLSNNIIEVSTDSAVGITAICASASDIGDMENISITNNNIECTSTNNDAIKITTLDQSFVKDNDITGGVNAINALGSRNTAIKNNTADGQTNFLRLATDGTNANTNLKVANNEGRNLVSTFYSTIDSSTSNIEHSANVSDSPIDTMLGTGWSFRAGSGEVKAVTTGTENLYASAHTNHYTNDQATANTAYTINNVHVGLEYTFTQTNATSYTFAVSPPTGVSIGTGGSGKDMYLNTDDGTVTIRAISTTQFEIVSDSGVTITYEP